MIGQASLLVGRGSDSYQARRHLKRSEVRPVLPRHRFVLELHLAGKKPREIEDLTGYSQAMIYRILASEEMVTLRQQIMFYYDQEFETLFPDVIEAVKSGLVSDDLSLRLDAAKIWLKAHGKLSDSNHQSGQQVNLTAEDIVINILNQRSNDTGSPGYPNTLPDSE